MSVYSVDKLMSETRRLAAEYHKLTGQVLPVGPELSRYDVARILNFSELPSNNSSKGVDLLGAGNWSGLKVQVKSRVLFTNSKSRPKVGNLNIYGDWDITMLVIMNANYEPEKILSASKELLVQTLTATAAAGGTSKRGSISVARFAAIADCIWSV